MRLNYLFISTFSISHRDNRSDDTEDIQYSWNEIKTESAPPEGPIYLFQKNSNENDINQSLESSIDLAKVHAECFAGKLLQFIQN